ncbi:hypothetical protein GETHLI_27770 [Geothrix limicola]|uniref:Acyltransferase n=1 Tax=Geothrix limicola TaxID=2927978 RepID=A0ABQ5QHE2_9BACT|nr:acyltransferase [Geothrix limicola]GLH74275.1 hypothetical protein GETHLI_27770 [Geothrix limicola]
MMFRFPGSIYVRIFRILFARRFRRFGRKVSILFPAGVEGAEHIILGDGVFIAYKTFLAALPLTGMSDCLLEIGEGSCLGRFNHIYATHRVVLGSHVLTANNVYISDNLHGFRDPSQPILKQAVTQNRTVEIGAGSWLGHNVCVLGAKIGRNCVVGANSVVTRDIPDYSVAVGVPAIIIRRYDTESEQWRKTSPDGTFLVESL